ncbi:MAG: HIT family protein [Actinobacteria bacterium]|nr:HIT family protein [Actinomycetota bacterium]
MLAPRGPRTAVPDCTFCRIVADEPDQHVFADDHTVAFLDTSPLFHGHLLVVTREHVVRLDDLDPDHLRPLFVTVQRGIRTLERELGAPGAFVANNNTVSQSVPHLHVHVVPRRPKDGLKGFFWPRTRYAEGEREGMRDRLRDAWAPAPGA